MADNGNKRDFSDVRLSLAHTQKEKTVEEMDVVNDGLDAVEREVMGLLEVLVV